MGVKRPQWWQRRKERAVERKRARKDAEGARKRAQFESYQAYVRMLRQAEYDRSFR